MVPPLPRRDDHQVVLCIPGRTLCWLHFQRCHQCSWLPPALPRSASQRQESKKFVKLMHGFARIGLRIKVGLFFIVYLNTWRFLCVLPGSPLIHFNIYEHYDYLTLYLNIFKGLIECFCEEGKLCFK